MSELPPSKPFTMAVAVGGVPTSQYGTSPYNNFEGSSIYQDGLQPLSVDGGGQLQVGGNWQKPTGSSVPGAAVLVGGRYAGGPTFLPLNLDSSGNIIISSSVGSLTVNQGTQGTAAEGWFVELTDGTNVLGTSGHPLYVQDAILEASVALSGASITGLKYQAVAGSDGIFLRPMLTSSTGQIHVIVDSGGGTNLSVGPTGSPVPADATLIGGLDPVGGVNLYAAGVDTDNRLYVIDQVVQQAVQNTQENDTSGSGQPIDIVGGWQPSASAFYALQLDADGNLNVNVEAGGGSSSAPSATVNAAEPTTVSPIAGSDGALVRPLKVDPTGRARVVVDSLPPVQILQDEDAPYYDSVEDSVGRYAVGAYANTQAQIAPPIEALLTGTIDDLGLFRPLVTYSGDLAASLKADGVSNPPALTGALRVVMSPDPISGVISGGVLNLPTLDVNMNEVTAIPTGNSPTTKVVQVGAVYNASNQSIPLQVDINKNLLVDVAAFTAVTPGQASPNSTLPGDASMVAGSDGLLMRVLSTDPRGALKVIVENDPLLDALLEGALEPIPVVVDGAPVVNPQGVLRVQEDNATLFSSVPVAGQSTTTITTTAVAPVTANCVAVTVLGTQASTLQFGANLCVRVRLVNGIVGPWQSCGLLWGAQTATLFFNLPVMAGQVVSVDCLAPAAVSQNFNISAALLAEAVTVQLRPDGRGLPLNTNIAQNVGTSATNVLSASAAGFRYLVGWSLVHAAGASTAGVPQGTLNGGAVIVGAYATTGVAGTGDLPDVFWQPPGGLLLDPATAIANGWSAGTIVTNVGYDIVPI